LTGGSASAVRCAWMHFKDGLIDSLIDASIDF
jgi:hypothetical protein